MATLQDIRGQIEVVTATALQAAGINPAAVVFDNTTESRPEALPMATIALSFSRFAVEGLGPCEPGEAIVGSVSVTVATAKGQGSSQGEAIGVAVMKAWAQMHAGRLSVPAPGPQIGFRNIEGPVTVAPGVVPVHAVVVAASFSARV